MMAPWIDPREELRLSFVRIWIVARSEALGLFRSHPYRLFLPVAALVVLLGPMLVLFAFRERAAMTAQVGVSAASFFAILSGLLAGANTLARERQSGLSDVLLARSLSPAEYVTGKWLGISAAGALAVVILSVVHLASVAWRGGPPHGYLPLVGALLMAAVSGGLAAAVGLFFSTLFRPGTAFSAALLFVLGAHAVALMGETAVADVLRFALPRLPEANLGAEAAFGPFPAGLPGWSALPLSLYTAFLLSVTSLMNSPLLSKT